MDPQDGKQKRPRSKSPAARRKRSRVAAPPPPPASAPKPKPSLPLVNFSDWECKQVENRENSLFKQLKTTQGFRASLSGGLYDDFMLKIQSNGGVAAAVFFPDEVSEVRVTPQASGKFLVQFYKKVSWCPVLAFMYQQTVDLNEACAEVTYTISGKLPLK